MSLNTALLKIPKRAEANSREKLLETFVDVGPLFALLSNVDHQIVFGRRGTGKTHALSYLGDLRQSDGDVVAFVDLRNVGSSVGVYADETLPLAERATRLLVDVLTGVHDALYEFLVDHDATIDLATGGAALDRLAEAITEVKVVGQAEYEVGTRESSETRSVTGASAELSTVGATVSLSGSKGSTTGGIDEERVTKSGEERLHVNFGTTGSAFRDIIEALGNRHLWLLLDEWSSVPIALQPYLADLLRRSVMPVSGATLKIAAIEQRSEFRLASGLGDYVGIELGADASADINLDDYMVFDNDAERAQEFFEDLISRHLRVVLDDEGQNGLPSSSRAVVRQLFTEKRAIEEFVRSTEGVPRDAIHILALAAQRAGATAISVQNVRVAARDWYQRDKEKAASANERAHQLLHWITDEVIGNRRARAFLLGSQTSDPLINALYDARVLHVLKRGISTHDEPGSRFDVYKLDYGCYVDLMSTAKAPRGLLPSDGAEYGGSEYVDVPPDDYRSIRRAILNLEQFRANAEEE